MSTLTRFVLVTGLIGALAPAIVADTHKFAPVEFFSTFSGAHPPALRIKSGDRVVTTTLDDVGTDAAGKQRVQGPNPQTGPFYVEGAEPGDLLVVTLEKLTPNRATGYSTSVMLPASIDPGSITSKPDATRFPWTIDTAKGVVRLDLHAVSKSTDWRSRFIAPQFEMPLRPSLGSIGVAPARAESLRTTTAGPFGGNLVSSALTAGSRVMLPVLQTGALLFLGHAHARQGDGGVTGTGIETSMDVEFSVES